MQERVREQLLPTRADVECADRHEVQDFRWCTVPSIPPQHKQGARTGAARRLLSVEPGTVLCADLATTSTSLDASSIGATKKCLVGGTQHERLLR